MYCSNCGNRLNDSDEYCGKCGKKIKNNGQKEEHSFVVRESTQNKAKFFDEKAKQLMIRIMILLIPIIIGITLLKGVDRKDEGITRFEWIKMLALEFGVEETNSYESYYEDVNVDNSYYGYVQALVEANVLDDTKIFDGENEATGEFVAITALRAVGENKIKLFLGKEDSLLNKDYLKLAYENNLIKKKQRDKAITSEEAEKILSRAKELSYLLWADDLERITYTKDVVLLNKSDNVVYDEYDSTIQVSEKSLPKIDVGNVVVFEEKGMKIAKKIEKIDEKGIIYISNPKLEEIIESLKLSDITTISFNDIKKYYGFDERDKVTDVALLDALNNTNYNVEKIEAHDFNVSNKGFSFSFISSNEEFSLIVTDLKSGESYRLPIDLDIDEYIQEDEEDDDGEIEIEATFNVEDIDIGGQLIWDKGVEYTSVVANANINQNISAKMKSKELPLFEMAVPLGSGVVSVELKISLVVSAEGEVSIKAETPMGINLLYDREGGIRNIPIKKTYLEPQIETSSKLGIDFGTQAILKAFKVVDIMDAKADIGASASAKISSYDTQTCIDAKIVFPIVTLSAMNEDTLLGELFEPIEWEIISEENAIFILDKHFESYTGSTKKSQFVEKCTYLKPEKRKISERKKEKSNGIERFYGYDLPLSFCLDYTYDENSEFDYNEFFISDEGDYYLVQGSIVCPECVGINDIYSGEGNTFFTGSGFEYKVLGEESYNDDQRQRILLEGEDGKSYEISNLPAFQCDMYTGALYYVISSVDGTHYKTVYENVKLRINKDTHFTDEDGNKEDVTFEYAVNNGWFEDVSYNLAYDIHFLEDGTIDILSPLDIGSNGILAWYGPECERRIGVLE